MSVDAPRGTAVQRSSEPTAWWVAAARCLALDSLASSTSHLFTTAGIPNILLKGPASARRLYPENPDRRTYSDVDLLVAADRFDAAEDALRALGYRCARDGVRDRACAWHETSWRATGSVLLTVDLHRGFAGVDDPDAFFAGLWAAREHLELCGTTIPVPSEPGTALILALHAANPGRGLKPLADIQRAHAVFGVEVWRAAAASARDCRAESAFRAGLGLLPDGSRFADELGVGGTVSADQWLGGRQRNRVSVEVAKAVAQPTISAKVGYLIRRTLPSPAFMRMVDTSAGGGLANLAVAYLRRMTEAATGVPCAIIDVTEARRALRRRQSRPIRLLQFAGRMAVHGDARMARAAVWALLACREARRTLTGGALSDVDLAAPTTTRPIDRQAVLAVLRARGASCLERAVVLQRFDAAAGHPRALIIGVSRPSNGFRAHAWLEGDPQPATDLHEIARRAAPDSWSRIPQRGRQSGTIDPLPDFLTLRV